MRLKLLAVILFLLMVSGVAFLGHMEASQKEIIQPYPKYGIDIVNGDMSKNIDEEKTARELSEKQFQEKQKAEIEAFKKKIFYVGDYQFTGEESEVFLKKLGDLMFVANNDLKLVLGQDDVRTENLKYEKIDMDGRRAYFSEQGWNDYGQYVDEQRERIKSMHKGEHGMAFLDFRKECQEYKPAPNGRIQFKASGGTNWSRQDSSGGNGIMPSFQFSIMLQPLSAKPLKDFRIDSLSVRYCNWMTGDKSCEVKGKCIR